MGVQSEVGAESRFPPAKEKHLRIDIRMLLRPGRARSGGVSLVPAGSETGAPGAVSGALVRVRTTFRPQQPDSKTARKYWNKLKERLGQEASEMVMDCHQLKTGCRFTW